MSAKNESEKVGWSLNEMTGVDIDKVKIISNSYLPIQSSTEDFSYGLLCIDLFPVNHRIQIQKPRGSVLCHQESWRAALG